MTVYEVGHAGGSDSSLAAYKRMIESQRHRGIRSQEGEKKKVGERGWNATDQAVAPQIPATQCSTTAKRLGDKATGRAKMLSNSRSSSTGGGRREGGRGEGELGGDRIA